MTDFAVPLTRVDVVGVPVDVVTTTGLIETVLTWTEGSESHVAVGVNANVCNAAHRDRVFRDQILGADLLYADGQSIVIAARMLGTAMPHRVATTDLIYPLMKACAAEGKRVYLFGAAPGVARAAADVLEAYAPGLRTRVRDGYGDAADDDALVRDIRDFGTDVLLVGLGDPLQQRWIAAHRDVLAVPAILSCGGLFDWTSGSNRRAPEVMIRFGFEWLWRLMIEPKRLAKRYLVGNPVFVGRLLLQLLAQRAAAPRADRA